MTHVTNRYYTKITTLVGLETKIALNDTLHDFNL